MHVEEWRPNNVLAEIPPRQTPIWVRLWGIPLEYQYPHFAMRIAQVAAEVLECEWCDNILRNLHFLRVKVLIDPKASLIAGAMLHRDDGALSWVDFRYGKAFKVCRRCGIPGHTSARCNLFKPPIERRLNERIDSIHKRFGHTTIHDLNHVLFSNNMNVFLNRQDTRKTEVEISDPKDNVESGDMISPESTSQDSHRGNVQQETIHPGKVAPLASVFPEKVQAQIIDNAILGKSLPEKVVDVTDGKHLSKSELLRVTSKESDMPDSTILEMNQATNQMLRNQNSSKKRRRNHEAGNFKHVVRRQVRRFIHSSSVNGMHDDDLELELKEARQDYHINTNIADIPLAYVMGAIVTNIVVASRKKSSSRGMGEQSQVMNVMGGANFGSVQTDLDPGEIKTQQGNMMNLSQLKQEGALLTSVTNNQQRRGWKSQQKRKMERSVREGEEEEEAESPSQIKRLMHMLDVAGRLTIQQQGEEKQKTMGLRQAAPNQPPPQP
ncbi:hypothetical protein PTKIN_Ptkin05aG0135500 [Pterospermum kingtungense]